MEDKYLKTVVASIKSGLYFSVLFILAYFCHRRIQQEYYSRCAADVIQILFFRNSHFCVILRNMSDVIETGYFEVFQKVFALTAAGKNF